MSDDDFDLNIDIFNPLDDLLTDHILINEYLKKPDNLFDMTAYAVLEIIEKRLEKIDFFSTKKDMDQLKKKILDEYKINKKNSLIIINSYLKN